MTTLKQSDEFVIEAVNMGARRCARCLAEGDDLHGLSVERHETDGHHEYLVMCVEHGGWRSTMADNIDEAVRNWNDKNDMLEDGRR